MIKIFSFVFLIIFAIISLINTSSVIIETYDPTTIIHGVEFPEEYINRHIEVPEMKPFSYYLSKHNNGTRNTL